MDTLALLVSVLLCLAIVNGRSVDERRETDPVSEAEDEGIKKHGSELRHQRRRRWQMNYGYEFPPTIPAYYQDRRDYNVNQQDLLPRIVKLLEDISVYIKRPQPPPLPPQPIYIPYPVPYPVPHYVPCTPQTGKNPNITIRFPNMEDTNQNWGFVMNENVQPEDDDARPISFDPIKPKRPLRRPAPKVEHGSEQSDSTQTTSAPKFDSSVSANRSPAACNAAILICCNDSQKQQCFKSYGCGSIYDNGKACDPDSLNDAVDALKSSYSPMQ